jgi:hypothetical protein
MMHLRQRQRRSNEGKSPHLAATQLEAFSMVGKPLPTSSDTGVSLRNLMARMGHDNERAALIYQHKSSAADRRVADSLDALLRTEQAHDDDQDDDDDGLAGVLVPVG